MISTATSRMMTRMAMRRSGLMLAPRACFSSECEPAQRIKCVLEEYRLENFSDETPSRFKKHIVKAIAAPNGVIELKSLNAVLENIGRSDAVLSKEEETLLLKEAGAKDGSLSVAKMMELM